MKLAPYPDYKDAGVSWVGSIPAHWPEKRAKYYFKEVDERSQTGDEEMLSVSHITGVTPRSQKNVTMFKAESNVGQKRCQPGDLVINTMWAWMSALGVSNHAGIVSPAYGVYRPRSNQAYDNYYLDHLLRIEGYRSEYICRSTGIRSSRLRLYPDKFLSMPVVCPPQEEQQTIARFLKAQDRLFRKFIRNKRRLIELLKEQKQNVINQAVTRGLNPKVRLKPSGVEWIGDIPEHWEVRRLKFLCHNLNEQTSEKQPGETYIALEHVESWTGRISLPDDEITFDSQVKRFQPGDVLFGKLRPYLAKVTRPQTVGVCVGEFLVLRATGNVSADFLEQKLRSKRVIDLINSSTFGAKMPRADWTFIGNLKFAYPPADEQQKILEHIQEKSAEIDQAIIRAEREIELMREYRTRLISDVVTGQVDVRGIEVPEVAEEELLTLDEDTAETDDVIDDEGDMDETD
jgi:type I restriction enzyme S subunit